jgi:hypothetical protein
VPCTIRPRDAALQFIGRFPNSGTSGESDHLPPALVLVEGADDSAPRWPRSQ